VAPYVARRVGQSFAVVIVVLIAVFLASQVIGDPVRLQLPLSATDEQVAALRQSLGYDDPLVDQFARFIGGAARGDFGVSLWQRQPALGLAFDRLGATLLLATSAIVVAFVAGVGMGLLGAARPRTWLDKAVSAISLTAVSVVEFWIALILIYVFAVKLHILPTSGYGSFEMLILPTIVLALRPAGRIAQFTRAAVTDELAKPYVRAAVARGIPRRRIVSIHALKNVSVPLLTLTSDEYIAVISTAVIIETIFAWPGVGSLLLQAIHLRDLPLVVSCVFIFTVAVVFINLVVDLLYGVLDRRARVA
jgi:peptide/nickel transport system permease protein